MSATNQSAQDSAPCDAPGASASAESERSEAQPERTRSRTLLDSERGQSQDLPSVILMIGIAVVSGFVVLYLSSEVIAALDMEPGPNESAPPLYESYTALREATNSAFGLFGLLFIVVILSVAIVYLWRIRGAR